jgi:hypothetical protein
VRSTTHPRTPNLNEVWIRSRTALMRVRFESISDSPAISSAYPASWRAGCENFLAREVLEIEAQARSGRDWGFTPSAVGPSRVRRGERIRRDSWCRGVRAPAGLARQAVGYQCFLPFRPPEDRTGRSTARVGPRAMFRRRRSHALTPPKFRKPRTLQGPNQDRKAGISIFRMRREPRQSLGPIPLRTRGQSR